MESCLPAEIGVALMACDSYQERGLKGKVAQLITASGYRVSRGERLLLKPNLVAVSRANDLACTHPALVAAVAEYLLDCGAVVAVADSPATGSPRRAMERLGLTRALAHLAVDLLDFRRTRTVTLPSGIKVAVAADALACDGLINLAKVKAHAQVGLTMAMKNYFGVVKGWHKALAHQRYGGGHGDQFFTMLLELPNMLPPGFSLLDGVTAMHRQGPIHGEPFALGLLGASLQAVALDTAMLQVLGLAGSRVPLWQAACQQGLPGSSPAQISYPLARPEELRVEGFRLPRRLSPLRFSPAHVVGSLWRRLRLLLGRNP
ncbi:MAG: DUF362 domain-containing protein [Thermodesulfobacteriota bacterium]